MADNNKNEMNEDEKDLIKSYFFQSFEYKDILRFLSERHGISISKSTIPCAFKSIAMSKARRIRKISVFTSSGKFSVFTLSYVNTYGS